MKLSTMWLLIYIVCCGIFIFSIHLSFTHFILFLCVLISIGLMSGYSARGK